jgi:hypothetical protein
MSEHRFDSVWDNEMARSEAGDVRQVVQRSLHERSDMQEHCR